MTILILLNPTANKGRAKQIRPSIETAFTEAGLSYQLIETSHRKQATELVKEGDYSAVVVAGGDGTINEVITGMMDAHLDIPLGILPVGTGNDLAYSLGLTADCHALAQRIKQGDVRPMDIGEIRTQSSQRIRGEQRENREDRPLMSLCVLCVFSADSV